MTATEPQPEAPSLPVDVIKKQAEKAVRALQDYSSKQKEPAAEGFIFLVVNVDKISAKASAKPTALAVPHPWRSAEDPNLSICMITKDPAETEQARLKSVVESLPAIKQVDSVSALGKKHKSYEARRQLCSLHDLFLADERILPLLPRTLGKSFFIKKKQPVAVDLTIPKERLVEELKKAASATFLFHNTGPCTVIKVASAAQSVEHVLENMAAVLHLLNKRLPGGHANIRSVLLKTSTSISLPLFSRD